MKNVTLYFGQHTTRVDVVFYRYIGDESIKAITRLKQVEKKKPIHKLVHGSNVLLPQVWNNFISLDENKADLAKNLSESVMYMGKELPEQYELVTEGGFHDSADARSTKRNCQAYRIQ